MCPPEEVEKKEETKKTIYFHTVPLDDDGPIFGCYELDGELKEIPGLTWKKDVPPGLQNLRKYASAVWKSILYFLGGEFDPGGFEPVEIMNTVFAFDTISGQWFDSDQFKPMKSSRAVFTAVAASNKIFVFGSLRGFDDRNEWFERYDISKDRWDYLNMPPKTTVQTIISFAVHEERNQILLSVFPRTGIYVYDSVSECWLSGFDLGSPICEAPVWSQRVAIVDDVLFWHYAGEIYQYDLKEGRFLPQLSNFIIPTFELYRDTYSSDYFPRLTYLFHDGDRNLCVVWADLMDEPVFHCRKYQLRDVKRPQDTQRVELAFKAYSVFPFESRAISNIHLVELKKSKESSLASLEGIQESVDKPKNKKDVNKEGTTLGVGQDSMVDFHKEYYGKMQVAETVGITQGADVKPKEFEKSNEASLASLEVEQESVDKPKDKKDQNEEGTSGVGQDNMVDVHEEDNVIMQEAGTVGITEEEPVRVKADENPSTDKHVAREDTSEKKKKKKKNKKNKTPGCLTWKLKTKKHKVKQRNSVVRITVMTTMGLLINLFKCD